MAFAPPVHQQRADGRACCKGDDGTKRIQQQLGVLKHQAVSQLRGKARHVRGIHPQHKKAASVDRTCVKGQQQTQGDIGGRRAMPVGEMAKSAHQGFH